MSECALYESGWDMLVLNLVVKDFVPKLLTEEIVSVSVVIIPC